MKRQRQSEVRYDIDLKLIELGQIQAIPQSFYDACNWFLEYAPITALTQFLAKIFNVRLMQNQETSRTQLRKHWESRLALCSSLYQRCDFLLCVQSVYKNMQRLHFNANNIQMHIPHLFENIPITLKVQYFGQSQKVSIISSHMTHDITDAITISWDDVCMQVPGIVSAGLPLHFKGITKHAHNVLRIFLLEKQVVRNSSDAYRQFRAYRHDFMLGKRFDCGILLSICALNDFVVFHVRKECLSCLQAYSNLTIKALQNLVLSYIGIASLKKSWW